MKRIVILFLCLIGASTVRAQNIFEINYLGSYITHPGISFEYGKLLIHKPESPHRLYLNARAGIYFHKNLYRDAFVSVGPKWNRVNEKGRHFGFDLGFGFSKTMHYGTYIKNKVGEYELHHFQGDTRFIISPAISFGKTIDNAGWLDAWHVRNRFWYYPNYNGQSSFNYFLELGISHNI